mgnify:CR=1 FL=1
MDFILNISHILFIVYAVIVGAMGNITYRAEKNLPIKPIWLRVLWGCFALAVYLTALQRYLNIQELNLINTFPIFLLGFLSELIAKMLPDLLEKYKRHKIGGGDNGKK